MNTSKLSAIACIAITISLASAQAQFFSNYLTNNYSSQPISNIMMGEKHSSGGGTTWPFSISGGGSTLLTNPFEKEFRYERALLVGLTAGFQEDPEQNGFVMFVNKAAANQILSASLTWGALFPLVDEEALIASLWKATTHEFVPHEEREAALEEMFEFLDLTAATTLPSGQGLWFDIDGDGSGGEFSVITFTSQGWQLIGDGTSYHSVVPEPVTTAMLGMAAIAAFRRIRGRARATH